ncbi:hypothetical protein TWF694_011447 [Orbilia ellipsospora]|uniref:4Fe-4S ferredoxin-type domain-containing protein n=1 Tax=Orbilia ellipsospora TaxID=2528407 RepID=A0AAV9X5L4_9PEZI
MSSASGSSFPSIGEAVDAMIRENDLARRLFQQRLGRIGFDESLRFFSRETSINVSGYDIGISAASAALKTPQFLYVNVLSAKTPSDDIPNNLTSEWKKSNIDGYWNFAPGPESGAKGDDMLPIHVWFEGDDQVVEEAIAGNCLHINGTATATQGLVIRDNTNRRWGVMPGHNFVTTAPTSATNIIRYCAPDATEDGTPPECEDCVDNHCSTGCLTPARKAKRVPVSSGVTNIITCNPYHRDGQPTSIDLGAFLIPNNDNVRLYPLDVSAILSFATATVLTPLAPYGTDLFNKLAGAHTGIVGVSSDIVPRATAEAWMTSRANVFCFKKGMMTGWTYGRLRASTTNIMNIEAIGPTSAPGDCGSIWFVIDEVTRRAFPLGYHHARLHNDMHIVPYTNAVERLRTMSNFSNSQFLHLDSYFMLETS